MDYVFDLSLLPGSAAETAAALRAARLALERSLGGSGAQVLAAWLDCVDDGGTPPIDCGGAALTRAQRRWSDACEAALRASFAAMDFDPAAIPPEDFREMMACAWVSALPGVPAGMGKAAWQDLFLGRLGALRHDTFGEPVEALAERSWTDYGDLHPVCAADRVGIGWNACGARHVLSGKHAFYRELRAVVTEQADALPF